MKFSSQNVFEKTNTKPLEVITGTISNPSKILKMFTKDLYKHPLQTAIQEYINNAKDAHKMVGKNNSEIIIQAPTVANPQVIIKDQGPGLSPKEMKEIFAVITESNKDHSNLFNGGFGIGSKSWFAINDVFSLISTYNKKKYFYNITFTDNIYLNLHYIEDTKEENGVEVCLPLKSIEQIPNTKKAISRAIKYWESQPKVLNHDDLCPIEPIYRDKDVTFHKRNVFDDYWVDVTLGETIYSVRNLSGINALLPQEIPFNIGIHFSLDEVKNLQNMAVGPDRENFSLEMSPLIKEKITNSLNLLKEEVVPKYIEKFKDPLSLINALHENDLHRYLGYKSIKIIYKGFNVEFSSYYDDSDLIISDVFSFVVKPYQGLRTLQRLVVDIKNKSYNNKILIVEDDLSCGYNKARELIQNHLMQGTKYCHAGITGSLTKIQKEFLKELGIDSIKMSSIKTKKAEISFSPEHIIYVYDVSYQKEIDIPNTSRRYYRPRRVLPRHKYKVSELDKSYLIMTKEDEKAVKKFGVHLYEIEIDAYITAKNNIQPLVDLGFQKFSFEEYKKEAQEVLKIKKYHEQKKKAALRRQQQAKEKKAAKIKSDAKSPEFQEALKYSDLYDYLKRQLKNKSVRNWLADLNEFKTKNKKFNKLKNIKFPENYYRLRKITCPLSIPSCKQDQEILAFIKMIKKDFPLTFECLLKNSGSTTKRKEIESLINNLPKK